MTRLSLPSENPGVSRTTWWRAQKRGYLTVDYHIPKMSYVGKDYLSSVVEDLIRFSGHQARWILRQWGLLPQQTEEIDRCLEWDDLIQIGALRCLELKSHERGKENWRFFAGVAMRAQSTALKHGKHRGRTARLDALEEEIASEEETSLADSRMFFDQCLALIQKRSERAAIALKRWREEGGEGDIPPEALKILVETLRG